MPGLLGLRVPARAAIIVMLVVALFSSYGLGCLFRTIKEKEKLSWVILFGFILCASAEFWTPSKGFGKFPYNSTENIPVVYEWISGNVGEDEAIVHIPFESPQNETLRMYFSTFHWKKMVNGYSGYRSGFAINLQKMGLEDLDKNAIEILQDNKVRYIVVDIDRIKNREIIPQSGLKTVFSQGNTIVLATY